MEFGISFRDWIDSVNFSWIVQSKMRCYNLYTMYQFSITVPENTPKNMMGSYKINCK